jgi:hypothetical protein
MYREEEVTIARATSQQQKNTVNNANGGAKLNSTGRQPSMISTKITLDPPQRRNIVFADPVAFRYIVFQGQILLC